MYWDYYKKEHEEKSNQQWSWNHTDNARLSSHDLYVRQKYDNLKQEIMQNEIYQLNYNQFSIIVLKANKYMDTDSVKSMRADVPVINKLKCDIRRGTPLLLQNLVCLMLYTDESDLCTNFSSTFRQKQSYEPLTLIKNRNREYWNWSKTLRETVQFYGSDRWSDGDRKIKGPFFCGMYNISARPLIWIFVHLSI